MVLGTVKVGVLDICVKGVIAGAAWQTRAARAVDWGEALWIAASLRSSQ